MKLLLYEVKSVEIFKNANVSHPQGFKLDKACKFFFEQRQYFEYESNNK